MSAKEKCLKYHLIANRNLMIPFKNSAIKSFNRRSASKLMNGTPDNYYGQNLIGLPHWITQDDLAEYVDSTELPECLTEQSSKNFDEYSKMLAHSSGDGEPRRKHNGAIRRNNKRHKELFDKLTNRKTPFSLSSFAGALSDARDLSGLRLITEETATYSLDLQDLRFQTISVMHGQAIYEASLKEAPTQNYLIIKSFQPLCGDLKDLVVLYLKQLTEVDSIKEMRLALYTCLAMLGCMIDDIDADALVLDLARKHKLAKGDTNGELALSHRGGIKDRAVLLRLCRTISGQNHSKADIIYEEYEDKL